MKLCILSGNSPYMGCVEFICGGAGVREIMLFRQMSGSYEETVADLGFDPQTELSRKGHLRKDSLRVYKSCLMSRPVS